MMGFVAACVTLRKYGVWKSPRDLRREAILGRLVALKPNGWEWETNEFALKLYAERVADGRGTEPFDWEKFEREERIG